MRFADAHPDRFIQFGISEKNMVSAAPGLAATRHDSVCRELRVVHRTLTCEQIRTDVAYSALRCVSSGITRDRARLLRHVASRHERLAMMRSIADLAVIAPATAAARAAIKATVMHPQPIYFRIGRGRSRRLSRDDVTFELGKAIVHREGDELTLIVCGTVLHPAIARSTPARVGPFGGLDRHAHDQADRPRLRSSRRRAASSSSSPSRSTTRSAAGRAVAEVLADAGVPRASCATASTTNTASSRRRLICIGTIARRRGHRSRGARSAP
jgi:transketolase